MADTKTIPDEMEHFCSNCSQKETCENYCEKALEHRKGLYRVWEDKL